jgi:hypothetical protein
MLPNQALLDTKIKCKSFAGEKGQEGLAESLVLRTMLEGNVVFP